MRVCFQPQESSPPPPAKARCHSRASYWLIFSALILSVLGAAEARAQRARASSQPAGSLATQVAALLNHPDVREAHWGVSVISLKTGKVVTGVSDEKLFIPASTVKLFPAAAALSLLGSEYKYTTSVYCSLPQSAKSQDGMTPGIESNLDGGGSSECAGDLVLVGRGDPNLSGRVIPFDKQTERDLGPIRPFRRLAEQIAARGIRGVAGKLIADDRHFVHQPYGTGWEHDDLMWLSAAQSSALAINDNVLFLSVFPGAVGGAARIEEVPMAGFYTLDNRTLTVPRTVAAPGGGRRRSRRNLGLGREPGSLRLRLWGEIPEGVAESSYAVSIEDPPKFAGEYLRRELAALGVSVKGEVEVRRLEPMDVDDLTGAPFAAGKTSGEPPEGELLAEHISAPLAESLRVTLKVSQNLHAEMLLRTLGRELRGVGSAEAGLAAIDDFLIRNGLAARGVRLRDGSGLARQNLVSPAAMTTLLRHMYQSEHGAAWTAMLAEAGVDGTLRNRLRGRYTTGRVWAKTGSLLGVAALAGYVRNQSNDLLAFAIFANHYNDDDGSVLTVVDNLVTALARSR